MFVWINLTPERIGLAVRRAIEDADIVMVSVVTAWEIAIKLGLGRLTFPIKRFDSILAEESFDLLAIEVRHAIAAGALPRHHGDRFDRMLVAQAQTEELVLVSEDALIRRYDVPILG